MAENNSTQITQTDIELGIRDIKSGLLTLSNLIEFIDGIHPDEYDPRMFAVMALAQKAGALLERGTGRAIGECDMVGDAGRWMTDPSDRCARAKLGAARHG